MSVQNNPLFTPVTKGMFYDAAGNAFETDGIQPLIELSYIQTGNNIIATHMNSLVDAVNLSNSIIQNLDMLQQIHNLVIIPSAGQFNLGGVPDPQGNPDDTSGTAYVTSYIQAASAFFSNQIFPDSNPYDLGFGITPYSLLQSRLDNLRIALNDQLVIVGNTAGTNSDLYNRVKMVVDQLTTKSTVEWMIDGYDPTTGTNSVYRGQIEQNLHYAMTACQGVNSTQQENVRSYFFNFQQYYQSASAILQQLTQIMQRMAQGIKQ